MADAIDVVLMLLESAKQRQVTGRTVLQKMAYFANEKAKLGLAFAAHFYGPFCRQVSTAVDSLVASGLIGQEIEEFLPRRSSMWEGRRYTYRLTSKGSQLTNRVAAELGEAVPKIREVVEAIEQAGLSRDYMALAAASKVHYIVKRSGKPLHLSRIPAEARRVGWNLSEAEITKVVRFLESLGMVRTMKG